MKLKVIFLVILICLINICLGYDYSFNPKMSYAKKSNKYKYSKSITLKKKSGVPTVYFKISGAAYLYSTADFYIDTDHKPPNPSGYLSSYQNTSSNPYYTYKVDVGYHELECCLKDYKGEWLTFLLKVTVEESSQTDDLSVLLKNVNGGSTDIPKDNGLIELYDSDGDRIGRKSTNREAIAIFSDVEEGSYSIEAYHRASGTLDSPELWCKQNIEFNIGDRTKTLVRNMPYFDRYSIFQEKQEITFGGNVKAGVPVVIRAYVKNPNNRRMSTDYHLVVGVEKRKPYEFDIHKTKRINGNSEGYIEFEFTPNKDRHNYYINYAMYQDDDCTDSGLWNKVFYTNPAPVYSFSVSLKNIDNTSTPLPGKNGVIDVYRDTEKISTFSTGSAGSTIIKGLKSDNYTIKGFHRSDNALAHVEYWGKKDIHVPIKSASVDLKRNMPYFKKYRIFQNGIEVILGSNIKPRIPVKIKAYVNNPNNSSQAIDYRLVASIDKKREYEIDIQKSKRISANSHSYIEFEFIPKEEGCQYYVNYSISVDSECTDSGLWHEAFTVNEVPVYDLNVSLLNVEGGAENLPGTDGKVFLFKNGSKVTELGTDANGVAIFKSLKAGRYTLKGYHQSDDAFSSDEFWCEKQVLIPAPSDSVVIRRDMPYFKRYEILQNNEIIPLGNTVVVSQPVTIRAHVRNPNRDSKLVQYRLVLDSDGDGIYEYDQIKTQSLSAQSDGTYQFEFTPTSSLISYKINYSMSVNNEHTDSGLWHKVFDVSPVPVYDLNVSLLNVEGGAENLPGTDGKVFLFKNGSKVTELGTDANGVAIFKSLKAGRYTLKGYHQSDDAFSSDEFWCEKQVSIPAPSDSVVIRRDMPYFKRYEILQNNEIIPLGNTVVVSQPVTIRAHVRNPNRDSKLVQYRLVLDLNGDGIYEYDQIKTQSLSAQSDGTYQFEFTPRSSHISYKINYSMSVNNEYTDSGLWHKAFDVSPVPVGDLNVNVVDYDGSAENNATVFLYKRNELISQLSLGSYGYYHFSDLELGDYDVRVEKDGELWGTTSVNVQRKNAPCIIKRYMPFILSYQLTDISHASDISNNEHVFVGNEIQLSTLVGNKSSRELKCKVQFSYSRNKEVDGDYFGEQIVSIAAGDSQEICFQNFELTSNAVGKYFGFLKIEVQLEDGSWQKTFQKDWFPSIVVKENNKPLITKVSNNHDHAVYVGVSESFVVKVKDGDGYNDIEKVELFVRGTKESLDHYDGKFTDQQIVLKCKFATIDQHRATVVVTDKKGAKSEVSWEIGTTAISKTHVKGAYPFPMPLGETLIDIYEKTVRFPFDMEYLDLYFTDRLDPKTIDNIEVFSYSKIETIKEYEEYLLPIYAKSRVRIKFLNDLMPMSSYKLIVPSSVIDIHGIPVIPQQGVLLTHTDKTFKDRIERLIKAKCDEIVKDFMIRSEDPWDVVKEHYESDFDNFVNTNLTVNDLTKVISSKLNRFEIEGNVYSVTTFKTPTEVALKVVDSDNNLVTDMSLLYKIMVMRYFTHAEFKNGKKKLSYDSDLIRDLIGLKVEKAKVGSRTMAWALPVQTFLETAEEALAHKLLNFLPGKHKPLIEVVTDKTPDLIWDGVITLGNIYVLNRTLQAEQDIKNISSRTVSYEHLKELLNYTTLEGEMLMYTYLINKGEQSSWEKIIKNQSKVLSDILKDHYPIKSTFESLGEEFITEASKISIFTQRLNDFRGVYGNVVNQCNEYSEFAKEYILEPLQIIKDRIRKTKEERFKFFMKIGENVKKCLLYNSIVDNKKSKPKLPYSIFPSNETFITNSAPTFQWSPFQNGGDNETQAGYQLRIRNSSTGELICETGFVASADARSLEYRPTDVTKRDLVTNSDCFSKKLVDGEKYHWHVRYRDSGGDWSDWSADKEGEYNYFTYYDIHKGVDMVFGFDATRLRPCTREVSSFYDENVTAVGVPDWVDISYGDRSITITPTEVNENIEDRDADITLSKDGLNRDLHIVQHGSTPYVEVDPRKQVINATNQEVAFIKVDSNVDDWEVEAEDKNNWYGYTQRKDGVEVTISSPNESLSDKELYLTFSVEGGKTKYAKVVHKGAEAYFNILDSETNEPLTLIEIASQHEKTIDFDIETNLNDVSITTQEGCEWLSAIYFNNAITFTSEEANMSTRPRSTIVNIKADNYFRDFEVVQSGADTILEFHSLKDDVIESIELAGIVAKGNEALSSDTVKVFTNLEEYYFDLTADWFIVEELEDKSLKISAKSDNYDLEQRTGELILSNRDFEKRLTIRQNKVDKFLTLSTDNLNFTHNSSEEVSLFVHSNTDWYISDVPDWIAVDGNLIDRGNKTINLSAFSSNGGDTIRSAEIGFNFGEQKVLLTVSQAGVKGSQLVTVENQTFSISEDSEVGAVVGKVEVNHQVVPPRLAARSLAYSARSASNSDLNLEAHSSTFTFNDRNELVVKDAKDLDYEKHSFHRFMVTASEKSNPNNSDVAYITVAVENINDNRPTLDFNFVKKAFAKKDYSSRLMFSDKDSDQLRFEADSSTPEWVTVATKEFGEVEIKGKPTTEDVGENIVRINVYDGDRIEPTTFEVSVTVIESNEIPTLTPTGVDVITLGEQVIFTLLAEDPDNDELSFVHQSSDWVTPEQQADNLYRYTVTTSEALLGSQQFTVTVSDGVEDVAHTFNFYVNAIPEINGDVTSNITVFDSYSRELSLSDLNEDQQLEVNIASKPEWLNAEISSNIISFSGVPKQAGSYECLVNVTDGVIAEPVVHILNINVAKADEVITFANIPAHTFGDAPIELEATCTSGGAITFQVVSGSATIENNTLTITGAGDITVKAVCEESSNYLAAQAVQTFTVAKAEEVITFANIPAHTFGDAPIELEATCRSGEVITYQVVSGSATIENNTLTITGAGEITVKAIREECSCYLAAEVVQTFTVAKADEVIAFANIPAHTFGDAPIELEATCTSGGAITYQVVSGSATIENNTLTITGAGEITVKAIREECSCYLAAEVVQSFGVSKAAQVISFEEIADIYLEDGSIVLNAHSSVDGDIQYEITEGNGVIEGNVFTPSKKGVLTIRAFNVGDANHLLGESFVSFSVLQREPVAYNISLGRININEYKGFSVELSNQGTNSLIFTDIVLPENIQAAQGTTGTITTGGSYSLSLSLFANKIGEIDERIEVVTSGNIVSFVINVVGTVVNPFSEENLTIEAVSPTCYKQTDGLIRISNHSSEISVTLMDPLSDLVIGEDEVGEYTDLAAGSYHIVVSCGESTRGYDVVLPEQEQVEASAIVKGAKATISVSGGVAPFTIYVNNEEYVSETGELHLEKLKSGSYEIEVYDQNQCAAPSRINFEVIEMFIAPNPAREGVTYLYLPNYNSTSEIELKLYTAAGKCVLSNHYSGETNPIKIDLDSFSKGTYILKVYLKDENEWQTFKLQILN